MIRVRMVAACIAIFFLLVTYALVRRRKLKTSYALLWLFTCLSIVAITFAPGALELLSRITGLYYVTALLLVCFVFLLVLFLHFSTVISKLIYQNRVLSEKVAFLDNELRSHADSGVSPRCGQPRGTLQRE
jgi:hypothetical protein